MFVEPGDGAKATEHHPRDRVLYHMEIRTLNARRMFRELTWNYILENYLGECARAEGRPWRVLGRVLGTTLGHLLGTHLDTFGIPGRFWAAPKDHMGEYRNCGPQNNTKTICVEVLKGTPQITAILVYVLLSG